MAAIPSGATATVRHDIGGLLTAAEPTLVSGAGLAIFVPYGVPKRRGIGDRLGAKEALRPARGDNVSGPGSPAARTQTRFETYTFGCTTRKYGEEIPAETREDYNENFDITLSISTLKSTELFRDHNARCIALALDPTNLPNSGTTGLNVSTPWSNQASSTPVSDIGVGMNAIRLKSGRLPNLLVINWEQWRALSGNQQIMESYGGKDGGRLAPVNPQGLMELPALAAALGIQRVVCDMAVVDGAAVNLPVAGQDQWPRTQAGLYLVADSEGEHPTMKPTFGRTFYWTKWKGLYTPRYWNDPNGENDIVEVAQCTDERVFDWNCAFRFTNVLA